MTRLFKQIGLAAAIVVLAVGCDKIEPTANGEYRIYAGSTATWTDGKPIAQPIQRAYVEKYTGPRCTNCPSADRTLDAVRSQVGEENMVQVSVNSQSEQFGAPFLNCIDMRTEDGAVWETYWGVSSYPTAFVNRKGDAYTGDMANIAAGVQSAIAESPIVAIEGKASGEQTISIDINIQFVQQYTDELTLSLVLIEDSLVYRQLDGTAPNPNYVHNHMLRDVITDVWGTDIDCTGEQGECRKATFSYTLPEEIGYWHIVALVCDKATHQVINSVECE